MRLNELSLIGLLFLFLVILLLGFMYAYDHRAYSEPPRTVCCPALVPDQQEQEDDEPEATPPPVHWDIAVTPRMSFDL